MFEHTRMLECEKKKLVYFYVCELFSGKYTAVELDLAGERTWPSSNCGLCFEQAASQADNAGPSVEVQSSTPEGEQAESRAGGDAPGQVGESEETAEQSTPQSSQLTLTVPGQDESLKVDGMGNLCK